VLPAVEEMPAPHRRAARAANAAWPPVGRHL